MIDPSKPNFGGTPVAPWRPRLEYAAADPAQAPIVTVVTPFRDAGSLVLETAESLRRQSLQAWEWVVVDDGSRDADALALLALAAERDRRLRVITRRVQQGRSRALNTGFLAARTPWIQVLEAGDLLEPTALEKSLWALLSHEEWSYAGSWSIERGERDELDSAECAGSGLLSRAPAPLRALVRREAFLHAGGWDASLDEGCEDWDFWLRCADRGLSGGTVPEVLVWRRSAPPAEIRTIQLETFRSALPQRYPRLFTSGLPERPRPARGAEREDAPVWNRLAPHSKRMLVILTSLATEGAAALLIDLLPLLQRQGWQIAVVSREAASADAAGTWARIGADLHVLDRFLRPADQPRYVRYLAESRRPAWVLRGPGAFAAAVTAYLHSRCAEPRYAELCHLDPDEPDLALGAASPDAPADLRLGSDRADVTLVPTVDTTVWKPRDAPRQWMRPLWGAAPGDLVVLFAGRLGPLTRADVLAETILVLAQRGAPVRAVIAASGPGLPVVREKLSASALGDRVRFLEPQSPGQLLRVFSAADLFFAPTCGGTAIMVLRAMACGLPVATAAAGGHGRIVDTECGICVAPADAAGEVRAYADALEQLARDPERRLAMGRAARQRVIGHFGLDALALPALTCFKAGESPPPREPEGSVEVFRSTVARCEAAREGAGLDALA
jgi:glycosyltransferase involved in cell wall biosynthesis